MNDLSSRDFRAALEFVEVAWGQAGPQAFTPTTLEALAGVIGCDEVAYCELDRVGQRVLEYVASDGGAADGDDLLFWSIVDEHPLCQHQQAYADFSATRLSDVISQDRLARTRVYSEWFRPAGVVAEMDSGITRTRARTRNFVFSRTTGDFSVRDRAMLDLLTPHLARIHESTELRRSSSVTPSANLEYLTTREAEILELVAAGLTNAAIAERLWISPGTVKKHLDSVYSKLGVANRTAAAAYVARR
jgi:DNA-binding CsgD family transcriptional regulator